MRHAKAEPVASSRPRAALAERVGPTRRRPAAGWPTSGSCPTHALVSTRVRTQQTWEAVADGAGWDLEPTSTTALYAAGPDSALDLMRRDRRRTSGPWS